MAYFPLTKNTHVCLFVCIFIIFKDIIYAQWVINDDGCRTPDGGVGDCIPIKQCKPIIDFLQNARKPLSQNTITKLNSYTCSYVANTVKVCCPPNPIVIEAGNSELEEGSPLPPDISSHRNYNLLPKDCGYLAIGDKIRYGQNASLNEFPWMALLSYNTRTGPQFRCGGSIINEKWILTAAHCVSALNDPLLGVRVGEHNIQQAIDCETLPNGKEKCSAPVQDLAIEEVRVHPEFSRSVLSNDIALLKVNKMDLSVESVRPVCLPIENSRDAKFKNVIVTGWGITASGQSSNILQKVSLPVVNLDDCQAIYKNGTSIGLNYKQICARGTEGKDSCSGDSGGPLHVVSFLNEESRYVQQGIVSFGPKLCGLEEYPGVYTRVAYYMDWILNTIGS